MLGRSLLPLLADAGHEVIAPGSRDLNLFDPDAVRAAVEGADAIYHLATRIPPPERAIESAAWDENDRLRSVASRLLVDVALATDTAVYIQPSVTFIYPAEDAVDESTPIDPSARLGSMVVAETETQRFTDAGHRGVVLRLGLLWGPHTGSDAPNDRYGATLHVDDAGTALLAALDAPSGIYNVVSDAQRVSNALFKRTTGWSPRY